MKKNTKAFQKEIFKSENPNYPMIFAIDFDGTIVEHNYPIIGKLLPGAKKTLKAIAKAGHHVIIWTCRETESSLEVMLFLKENKIPYHSINHNTREHEWSGSRKVYAHVYIDDRNFGGFPGWDVIYDYYHKKNII